MIAYTHAHIAHKDVIIIIAFCERYSVLLKTKFFQRVFIKKNYISLSLSYFLLARTFLCVTRFSHTISSACYF